MIYNFNPGPSTLPEEVVKRYKNEFEDFRGSSIPVFSVSHRGKDFLDLKDSIDNKLRDLLEIPDNYKILLMQGGATAQFSAVPLNILNGKNLADYIDTGHWSKKAIEEAKKYCDVDIAATSSPDYITIPPKQEWKLSKDSAYVHITTNETIQGIEYHRIPKTKKPLVADMSSNILSRKIDVEKFGLIYAGSQKNLGIPGVTIVIVRENLIGNELSITPKILSYGVSLEQNSLQNTPSVDSWFMFDLMLDWINEQGLEKIENTNKRKSKKLYKAIDESRLYENPVEKPYRSRMNVPFTLKDKNLEEKFLSEAKENGLIGLKGHRAVGGMRASIYNAMPEQGVDTLIEFMKYFERKH